MIHGLSDRRRLPRAGKIRLGEKALSERTGSPYPKAVDYFVWPPEYADTMNRLFGEKAREIDIMFPVEDREQVCPQYLKRYGAPGLLCRGDGVTAERVNQETGTWEEIECNPEECPHFSPQDPAHKSCRQVMNLRFIIPQLISEGVWQLDTSSYHSIVNVNSGLDYVQALVGRISMVPLRLRIVPREVQPDGRKKIVHVLEVRLASQLGLRELQELARGDAERPLLALPSLDENMPPDDLFPVEAVQYEAQAKPEPVDEVLAEEGDLPPGPEVMESEPEPEAETDGEAETDAQIAALFDQLGFTKAKQTLLRRRFPDRQLLLEHLMSLPPRPGAPKSDSRHARNPLPSEPDAGAPGSLF